MLSLYKLEIFAAVVQNGSFSAAAQQLYMSQPAVSQHIQDLEASLGTRLFERGRRGVTLTTAGETLHSYTEDILRLMAQAQANVTDVDNLAEGQITLGATPGVSVYMLPDWMRQFRERYPHLTIALQTAVTHDIVGDVLGGRLDVGFVEGELGEVRAEGLGRLDLCEIDWYVVVAQGHDWCGREDVLMHDLDGQPMIMRQPHSRTRVWVDAIFAEHAVKPRVVAEFDHPESIKQAVLSGMGLTILPDYALHRESDERRLHMLPIRDVPLKRALKLIYRENRPFSPVTRAFLALLTETFSDLATLLHPTPRGKAHEPK